MYKTFARIVLVLTFAAVSINGCGGGSSSSTSPPGASAFSAPSSQTGTVTVTHLESRPFPAGTEILRFDVVRNEKRLFGPVAVRATQSYTLAGVPAGEGVLRIDYLSTNGNVVGEARHGLKVPEGGAIRYHNPSWVQLPLDYAPVDDALGQYGAEDFVATLKSAVLELPSAPRAVPTPSPAPTCTPWPGCFTLPAFTTAPCALPPVADIRSQYFAKTSFQLPASTALTNLPVPRAQGTEQVRGIPGSCISWSFAYGMGSYTAARNPDGTVKYPITETTDAPGQVSSAFLYQAIHSLEQRVCPTGSSGSGYMEYLIGIGAPNFEQVPYHPNCTYLCSIDCTQAFPGEGNLKIGFAANVNLHVKAGSQAATRELLKAFMIDNHAIAFAGPVFNDFPTMGPASTPAAWFTNGVWYPQQGTRPQSGHGMMLAGYDDTLGDPNNPGAFLIQNSFGTQWPPQHFTDPVISPAPAGRFYLSYDAYSTTQLAAKVAYPVDPAVPSGPPLSSNSPGAPTSYVTAAYQYTGPVLDVTTSNRAWLVFMHWFSQPVTITSISVTEPVVNGSGGSTITQTNSFAMHDGYTYFVRLDGRSWLNGTYAVTVNAKTNDGTPCTWTGNVDVAAPNAAFPQLSPAPMPTDNSLLLGDVLTPGSAIVTAVTGLPRPAVAKARPRRAQTREASGPATFGAVTMAAPR